MANREIRIMAMSEGIKLWQIAEKLQIDPSTLSRWMRAELTGEKREKVLEAIKDIVADMEGV